MAEGHQRLFGGVLPLDDVGSGDIELAGTLHGAWSTDVCRVPTGCRDLRPSIDGSSRYESCVESLHRWPRATSGSLSQLARLLADLVDEATTDDVVSRGRARTRRRSVDSRRSAPRPPTRANFRTGHLTVCTLVPKR